MVDLNELRAKARAARAAGASEYKTVEVELDGEMFELKLLKASGAVWADLIANHPPRPGDEYIGYNPDAVPRDYPAELISIDGVAFVTNEGEPDTEAWQEVFDGFESPSIKYTAAALYTLNQAEPLKKILELGKARAGASTKKRRSPAK